MRPLGVLALLDEGGLFVVAGHCRSCMNCGPLWTSCMKMVGRSRRLWNAALRSVS